MWHAVVQEIHNGTLIVCVQQDDDWENARTIAAFTELEQQESPASIERWLEQARTEAAQMNAEQQRAEFEHSIPAARSS